ncbi:MAG: GTP-dependent phosphoenolpyruvate carboxykinase [Polaribacter sp.]|jgi:GTP-dependent phosphoenolpyruvate carboxykinase
MAKYKTDISKETIKQAEKMAKATQRPGQTKEQTKLIAQGIQNGIDQYKKQYKIRARELNKKIKNINKNSFQLDDEKIHNNESKQFTKNQWIPWCLLVISWVWFLIDYS